MLVNLNPAFGKSGTSFGAVKKIEFDGGDLKNDYVTQKELLKIFDDRYVQDLFEKHDGTVTFSKYVYPDKSLAFSYLQCSIDLYDNYAKRAVPVLDKYREKAKEMGFSDKEIKNMQLIFDKNDDSINYLTCRRDKYCAGDSDSYLAERLVTSVLNKTKQNCEADKDVFTIRADAKIKELDTNLNQILVNAEKERTFAKENNIAKNDVISKLKQLLG